MTKLLDINIRWILLIGLLIRILVIFAHENVQLMNEMKSYDKAAISLIEGKGFRPGGPGNRDMRSLIPPGYSTFLAMIYGVLGHSFLMSRIAQAILSSLSIFLVYRISKFMLGEKESLLAGWIMALYPQNLIMSDLLLTETLFTFLFLLAFNIFLAGMKAGIWMHLAVSGILFGLATLTRSIVFLFIPFYLFMSFVRYRSTTNFLKGLLVFTCMVFTIIPWTYRNWKVHGEFLLINSKAGIDFFLYNHPRNLHDIIYASPNHGEETNLVKSSKNEIDLNKQAVKYALNWIVNHPGMFVIKGIRNIMGFWGLERTFFTHLKGGYYGKIPILIVLIILPFLVLPFPILMYFAIPGILETKTDELSNYFMKILILYFMLIAFIAYSWSRQRYPLTPFLIIFSVLAWKRRKDEKANVFNMFNTPHLRGIMLIYLFLICSWCLEISVAMESLEALV